MAETPDTAPGHPDAVVINDDGSVTTRGGRGFVWVTDDRSGARYDVPARILPRRGLTPVPGYPVNYRAQARTTKPQRPLGETPPAARPRRKTKTSPEGAAGDESKEAPAQPRTTT